MKKRCGKILFDASIAVCLLLCLAAAAKSFVEWAETRGAESLLYLTGFTLTETRVESEVSEAPLFLSEEKERPPFLEEAEPSAASEEPQTSPDPSRESFPVEEIHIGGGKLLGGINVNDYTDSQTDLDAEAMVEPDIGIQANGEIQVLIYHTHTHEAYSEQFTGFYYSDVPTRTDDRDVSVVAVGDELARVLEENGIGVVHDISVCDELYNGSYSRSWEVIQRNLEQYPSIQLTIDIHRDSMMTDAGVKYKPTQEIEGKKAAQIMLIAGCDESGELGFPGWRDNLHLIMKTQRTAEQIYPGLFRPLAFSNSKYNMNATSGSMLAEVGTEVSTVDEVEYSGELLGKVLVKTLLG